MSAWVRVQGLGGGGDGAMCSVKRCSLATFFLMKTQRICREMIMKSRSVLVFDKVQAD